MVRMHAGRGVETQLERLAAFVDRGARDDDLSDARGAGALDHFGKVVPKRGMREVCAYVDQIGDGSGTDPDPSPILSFD